jgi:predicted AlkP superfamily pyrophosphatase or phosphodiesterase
MKIRCRSIVAFFVLIAAGCSTQRVRDDAPYSPLILISLDGFRADYLDRGLTPNLRALADDGVHAQALKPAFPTLTFPNHYTIVTGLYPDHHGIVNNRFVDPKTGKKFVYKDKSSTSDPSWWGGEPVWVSVEKQGKHAATMFWPGSDVAIEGVRPEFWIGFDGKIKADDRVDKVLSWFDLPVPKRPDFVTLYFEQADHAAHNDGPDSAAVNLALAELDQAIGRLVDGLKRRHMFESANIIIVSDHGMTTSSEQRVVVIDKVVNIADVDVVNTGVLAAFDAKPGREHEVETALLHPQEHMRCWRKSDIPARFHYGANARIPPYVCLADDGWLINTQEYLGDPKHHISLGEHGYDNDDPAMRALFIAHGAAFKHGLSFPEFDNVDIYPLMTTILHIQPQPNDGTLSDVQSMLVNP